MIQIHALAAMGAMATGAAQFVRAKGGRGHRVLGWAFVVLMMIVAISAFFIHTICQIGGFSAIHLLAIVTLVLVPRAVWAARRRRITDHRRGMIWLYALALVGAGIFTLLPGRLVYDVIAGTDMASHHCRAGD